MVVLPSRLESTVDDVMTKVRSAWHKRCELDEAPSFHAAANPNEEVFMSNEPSDPVERADKRREAIGTGDVKENADGTIEQREHGSMDASLVPKGKDHPEQGPYTPEHDHVDPDLEPDDDKK
jgi:hypothetical protein